MTSLRIRIPRMTKRQRESLRRAGEVAVCNRCTEHFGHGYGPLEGAKLGAVVRYHRRHVTYSDSATVSRQVSFV